MLYAERRLFFKIGRLSVADLLVCYWLAGAIAIVFGIPFLLSARLQAVQWKTWLMLFLAAALCDAASTYYSVGYPGGREMNPLARWIFEKVGVGIGLLISGSVQALLLLLLGSAFGKHYTTIRFLIACYACVHFAAAAWNILLF